MVLCKKEWEEPDFLSTTKGKYIHTDSWTNDPMKAMRWGNLQYVEAELMVGLQKELFRDLNVIVTQHEFVITPTENEVILDEEIQAVMRSDKRRKGNHEGGQSIKVDNEYHGGYIE